MAALDFILALSLAGRCWAEIGTADYVYWKKADISAWHQYLPSRALEGERQTNRMAVEAIAAMGKNISDSLMTMVRYPNMELSTAMFIMEGTQAQGCVTGIASFLSNAITDAISTYEDCSADAKPHLNRLYGSWAHMNSTYLNMYQRTLAGIDTCAKSYPNRDSVSRLKSCVDAWARRYYTTANTTLFETLKSPSMGVFNSIVVRCAEKAAMTILIKGSQLLSMLVQCAKLSDNIDSKAYESIIFLEYLKYMTHSDLENQISLAQNTYVAQIAQLEEQYFKYYDLEKKALEKYVIEPRSENFYANMLRDNLQNYYNTANASIQDNPQNTECSASNRLDTLVLLGSGEAFKCDETTVNDTKRLIAEVNDLFLHLNLLAPYYGNPAILTAFTKGYIFEENGIWNGFRLASSEFEITLSENFDKVERNVDILIGYEQRFFSNTDFPCGKNSLLRIFLEAERALYGLQRCLYANSGTNYDVTTSHDYGVVTTEPYPTETSTSASY